MEFVFFVGDFLLPRDAPVEHFPQVAQIVIILDNQKNAIRGKTVLHFCYESDAACPVNVGIDIFLPLRNRGYNPITPISDFPSDHGLRSVNASNIIAVIRYECLQEGAARLGFTLADIITHSLCFVGVISMHLSNVPNWTLMAIGRWRSLGFMVYTQQQISPFSTGVSVKMSQQTWFWHN